MRILNAIGVLLFHFSRVIQTQTSIDQYTNDVLISLYKTIRLIIAQHEECSRKNESDLCKDCCQVLCTLIDLSDSDNKSSNLWYSAKYTQKKLYRLNPTIDFIKDCFYCSRMIILSKYFFLRIGWRIKEAMYYLIFDTNHWNLRNGSKLIWLDPFVIWFNLIVYMINWLEYNWIQQTVKIFWRIYKHRFDELKIMFISWRHEQI